MHKLLTHQWSRVRAQLVLKNEAPSPRCAVKEAAVVGESNKGLMEKRSNQLFSMTSLIGIV